MAREQHVFLPRMDAILDRLSALFEIQASFFSAAGELVRVGEKRPKCQFCQLVQGRLGLLPKCFDDDRRQRRNALQQRGMVAYRCHAGLHEAIIPVYIAGHLVGYVMLGQFRSDDSPKASIQRRWDDLGGGDELLAAWQEVPRYSQAKIHHMLGLFELLSGFVADLHLVQVQGQNPLEPVLDYMKEHLEEHPPLTEAAVHVYRSPSTLSHQFRQILGRSYKQVQAQMLVERAETYLRSVPDMTVGEVAHALGFQDAKYFSRLFRKHKGVSPGQYQRALQRA